MSKKVEEAKKLFSEGFNCSQSVAVVFAEKYGFDKKTVLQMACGFGGGMRNGEICGAVSGAIMVVGMKYGHYNSEDNEQKNICNQKTIEFTNTFRERNKSILCKEILGCNIATLEGMNEAKEKNLFTTTCVEMVANAVELLEELNY